MSNSKEIVRKYKTLEDELSLFTKDDIANLLIVKEILNDGPSIDAWYCVNQKGYGAIFVSEEPERGDGVWLGDEQIKSEALICAVSDEYPNVTWSNEPRKFSIKINV